MSGRPSTPTNPSTGSGVRRASAVRRASILDAALSCFGDHGVEGAGIQSICARASCSVGSVYHHFGNRQGVLEALHVDLTERLHAGMLRRLRRCRSAEASVRTAVIAYGAWVSRHRLEARYLHAGDVDFSPAARQTLKALHRAYIAEVFRLFAPYVRTGEMRTLPVDTYIPLISGPIQEYCRRWLSGQAPAAPVRVKQIFADAAWLAVRGEVDERSTPG